MKPYFNFTKRASKTTERQKLVGKLDTLFSEYVRLRDADENGECKCITCGEKHHWRDMDCGHLVGRGNMATRWKIENANSQCRLCNSTHDGKYDEHAAAIDNIHGEGTALGLEQLGHTERHFSEPELIGMCDELRREIKALKEEKFK